MTRFGGDEGQAKEGNARDSFLQDTGEEAIEAEGSPASLGDEDLITSQDVDIIGLEVVLSVLNT